MDQGLLTGPAFTVVFTLSSLPLSILADRYTRIHVLTLGLVVWSALTAVTYVVQDFWQLLLIRMLLGIGEATCNPAVYSMLSDLFPLTHRATALSVYNFGVYIGGGIGYI
jgi:MFS transporter, Spinster family, sphingosine-1-phosphate transporter